jgi:mevalonate kinase
MNYPLLNHGNDEIEILMNEIDFDEIKYELIDTGHSRSTEPMVKIFLDNLENKAGYKEVMEEISSLNKSSIESLLQKDLPGFYKSIKKISGLQFEHMQEMVHPDMHKQWEDSLSSEKSAIKLCGAGGGGCYLKFNSV